MRKLLFYVLTIHILTSCLSENVTPIELVTFDNEWSSPYKISNNYCHHLENDSGKYLYILNKTAWAYFVCEFPEKIIENAKKHGANVIRVCLEGTPYYDKLSYDLWPWLGSRKAPDYSDFNLTYWDKVEQRIKLAGDNGIGIDLVLYFDLKPSVHDIEIHKKYWDMILNRLSKYSNILAFEIMNEYSSNEVFQDSAAIYIKQNDQFKHLVFSSDGTTEDALWPEKDWMDMAIVHTCTGNQSIYDLEYWYLSIARNVRQYTKPGFNNESGREIRHKNDDPVHRRKQAWLFSNSGVFWTWHSWDGCEGINDTSYFASGWQYLKPMRDYYKDLPFWRLEPNYTVCTLRDQDLVFATMSTPDKVVSVMYCCTKNTSQIIKNSIAFVRIKDGLYEINYRNPSTLGLIGSTSLNSEGLKNEYEIVLPYFQDDLIIEIQAIENKDRTLIDGTK